MNAGQVRGLQRLLGERDTSILALQAELDALELAVADLPLGWIVEAQVTASQNTITSVVDLTNLTVTWTAPANRRYKIEAGCHLQSASGTVQGVLALATGASGAGTTVRQASGSFITATADPIVLSHVVTPAAGSTSYHLRGLSSGTMNMIANTERYAFIRVTDVGAT